MMAARLLDALAALPAATLARLYAAHQACSLAVLRLCSALARHYVLRLLLLEPAASLPIAVLDRWLQRGAHATTAPAAPAAAIELLRALRIICIDADGSSVRLDAGFAAQLRICLFGRSVLCAAPAST